MLIGFPAESVIAFSGIRTLPADGIGIWLTLVLDAAWAGLSP
jgi:hypothetical protein